METQDTQQYTVPKSHKKVLYTAVGFSLIAVVLMLVVISGALENPTAIQTKAANQQSTPQAVGNQTAGNELIEVTPMPIASKEDISNALQQIDSTDPSAVEAELGQNTLEASQFSQ